MAIPKMGADNFDWIAWRRGMDILCLLHLRMREYSLFENARVLRKHAIGYIPGNKLFCRPDPEEIAVLFSAEGIDGWAHFRKNEFERIFNVE